MKTGENFMRMSLFMLFAVFFSTLSFQLQAQNEISDKSTGVLFPSQVTFDYNGKQYVLDATGVSTRKKFFINVYSVAHYLQKGNGSSETDKINQIMQDGKAKQLTIKWVHNVEADKIQSGYHESFQNALAGSNDAQLQNQIDQYIAFFNQDAKKGDEHILRWIPGGIIEVIINGNKAGTITNKDFARLLWSIWFGQKSVVNRDNLVSLMK